MKKKTAKSRGQTQDTAEFNEEFVIDTFKPMTARDRARWERIKRKPGRPRQGAGAKVVAVSIEKGLLEQSDRLAKKLGVTRANLIARGLRAVLAVQDSE
jgi:hypothetical protein